MMCSKTRRYNWAGDIIVRDTLVDNKRAVVGYKDRLIPTDIREWMKEPPNNKLSEALSEIPNLPEWKEAGSFNQRARLIWEYVAKKITYVYDKEAHGLPDFWMLPEETLTIGKGDCFVGETNILTINPMGFYEIKPIKELQNFQGYKAVSYNLDLERVEFQPIINWMKKGIKEIFKVSLRNGCSFVCTGDHRFFRYIPINFYEGRKKRFCEEKLSDINWHSINTNSIACIRWLPTLNKNEITKERAWIEGQYLADGWSESSHVCIAGDNPNVTEKLHKCLNSMDTPYSRSHRPHSNYTSILKSPLKRQLKHLGSNAFNKHLPSERLSLSLDLIDELIDGYATGDGYLKPPNKLRKNGIIISSNKTRVYQTSSDIFAQQLKILHLILGRPLHSWYQRKHGGIGNHPIWRLTENPKSCFNKEIKKDLSKVPIKSVEYIGKDEVYDITVANNHNFVLADSGVVAHNCEDSTYLLCSLLLASGISPFCVRAVLGIVYDKKGDPLGGHAWPCYLDELGKWRLLESTLDTIPATMPLADSLAKEGTEFRYEPMLCFNQYHLWLIKPSTMDISKYLKLAKAKADIRR